MSVTIGSEHKLLVLRGKTSYLNTAATVAKPKTEARSRFALNGCADVPVVQTRRG